jgi:hypothetical protein
MLVDDILSDANWQSRLGMSLELHGRLSKAPKFVLRSDFAIAADQFRDDLNSLERGRQFCRLPFDECWIEFCQNDRLIGRRIVPQRKDQVRKKRIGYLLTNTNRDGAFEGKLFVSIYGERKGVTWILAPANMHYDPRNTSLDTAYGHRQIYDTNMTIEQMGQFVTGEPRYLTAVLELLHSRNAVDVSPIDLTKLNRQRAKNDKPLLFSYRMVSIPARYKRRNINAPLVNKYARTSSKLRFPCVPTLIFSACLSCRSISARFQIRPESANFATPTLPHFIRLCQNS